MMSAVDDFCGYVCFPIGEVDFQRIHDLHRFEYSQESQARSSAVWGSGSAYQ